jgi:hypothetical protein
LLKEAGNPQLPLVVADAHDYLVFAYYASPGLNSRVTYIADPDASVEFTGTDSGDRQLLLLQHYYPLRIRKVADLPNHLPSFLVYSRNKSNMQWLPAKLAHDSAVLRKLAGDSVSTIYEVTMRSVDVVANPSISRSDRR